MKEEFDALFAEHQKLLGELQAMRALAGAECDRQPEQEPVAWVVYSSAENDIVWADKGKRLKQNTPLYTTPPQRTWVGLSREDCYQVRERESDAFMYGVAWAEAKLKEKNT